MKDEDSYIKRVWNPDLQIVELRSASNDKSVKEYYHTPDFYSRSGLKPILTQITEYFQGTRTVPVSKASTISGEYVFFTLSTDLLKLFIDDLDRIKKPYECALKYGFRGYSKGGKNGIFTQKRDSGLLTKTVSLSKKCSSEIIWDLDIDAEKIDTLKKVKIVYHDPSGERVVGLMNESNNRIIFLGFATY
jgi:hypothetical protein